MNTVPPNTPPRKLDRGFLFLCLVNIVGSFVLFDLSKPTNWVVLAFFAVCALVELIPTRYGRLTRWTRITALMLTVIALSVVIFGDLT